MLTRKRIPNINLSGDWQKDGPNLVRWISDYLLSLEAKGSLVINEAEITASQGIKFPATQVASSDVNTLDDYEEGIWTPNDASGASLSFSLAEGFYRKIGDVCFAWGAVQYPSTVNASTNKIGGLPFTVKNATAAQGGGTISYSSETTAARLIPYVNTTYCEVRDTAGGILTNATLSTDYVYFCAIYPVA